MRRHARAVILLGGWLLMWPLVLKENQLHKEMLGDEEILPPGTPVEKWEVSRAYDSAKACEAMRDQYQMNRKNYAGFALSATGWEAAARIRCVPAEHIYPPK